MSLQRLGGLVLLSLLGAGCSSEESATPGATGGSGGASAGGSAPVDFTGGRGGSSPFLPLTHCDYAGYAWEWCVDDSWCFAERSICVPNAWSCGAWTFGDGICSCGCGAPDPACKLRGARMEGCAPGRTCSAAGACEGVPPTWSCEPARYAAHDGCDCGCGIVDADCVPGGQAKGCATGESCSEAGTCTTPGALAPAVTIDTYPAVDGATATHPLAMVIACELLGMPWRWGWANAAEGRTVEPAPTTPAQEQLAAAIQAKIVHAKTGQAYMNLISGSADLILVASKPSTEELAYATSLGVELDVQLIARDALVFLVHGTNPVANVTVDQIKDIYTKQITNWSQVGGPEAAIHAYTRPEQSGSQQLMEELVMKGTSMAWFPQEMEQSFMGTMVDKLRSDALGLGYSVYYFVTYQYIGSGARLLKVNGVWPTYETLAKQQYPLTSETLVVTRTNLDPNCAAGRMRSWLLAPEGQQIVKKSGYVPIHL